ncbi:Chelated iron transport system membrane protein YfeD [Candidatus Filomicrobium marinum]|uniref:Chelated iron transport system membrane protein YfeD n=1 Tax=Candidatus Filomicrobium marinum TaxID=1608628 RepID=A0A0D6JAP0_9HYPH|nr:MULTISPECIES: metal ABC transporter permease [Filomicrobium]MCV0368555.1 metal ABC transporter permease [Filomicrobium sp.]CFX01733.1 Chelated iron transport system membrane protein YfeD [Candidatus Filomicrobium marinum]CPR15498.1 Chelated iron transport system membrane protein YfeD [Candidatus Filomicrobium marinum]
MTEWFDFITVPLSFGFMQRALVASVLIGAVCSVLSCYLVLKGWSLMGDAISHAVLPGIVLAYVAGLPLSFGAFVAGLTCAGLTGYLKENSRVKEDTVMGIVFSGMFGFGLVLFTKIHTDQHLDHILFGNLLGVSVSDLIEIAVIAGGTFLVVALKWRDLLLYCFDPQHARAIGLPVRVIHYGLLVLLALTIVTSLKAVGIILVVAMLVAPGAIAFLLTTSFARMLVVAAVVAIGSCITGTLISFHIDGATGPCIVLTQSAVFILAFLFGHRGVLRTRRMIQREQREATDQRRADPLAQAGERRPSAT